MTKSSITIRGAVPADADAIAEVHVASWRTTYPGIVEQSYIDGLTVGPRAAKWAQRLSSGDEPALDILVAVDPEQGIVGFSCGGVLREPVPEFDAELHAIYLLRAFQNAGVGRRLVSAWATLALERGLSAAIVRALAANPACRVYEHLGAELLRETHIVIGGLPYPERWYGWHDLVDLARLER
jgi:GNAT superfamily N-acetyltransferase